MNNNNNKLRSSEVLASLSINPEAEQGLITQIKKQITWMIASQKLKEGDRLPSVRELARSLGVNMHTVRIAYDNLESEGLIETRPRTRARVLNYDPVLFADRTIKTNNHTLGIILPSMSNPFYQAFLKGVQSVAEKSNYLTFVCSTYDDENRAWLYFSQLTASGVDGIISVSHDLSRFIHSEEDLSHLPPLVIADYPTHFGYSLELDHSTSGFLATNHLIEHGYEHIALVRYAVNIPGVLEIQSGYESALLKSGRVHEPELVILVNGFDPQSGEEAAWKLLSLPKLPDAVFVIADQLAISMVQTLQKAGIKIPENIAFTSFNNIPESAIINPGLTSVAAPAENLGVSAMSMLSQLISGIIPRHKHIHMPCSDLVIRQSCGCTQVGGGSDE